MATGLLSNRNQRFLLGYILPTAKDSGNVPVHTLLREERSHKYCILQEHFQSLLMYCIFLREVEVVFPGNLSSPLLFQVLYHKYFCIMPYRSKLHRQVGCQREVQEVRVTSKIHSQQLQNQQRGGGATGTTLSNYIGISNLRKFSRGKTSTFKSFLPLV